MDNGIIVTIGRQFCSGGAEIGKKLAEKLSIPYYDKEIIDSTAELLKINQTLVAKHDEKPTSVWDMPGFQYGIAGYSADPSFMLPLSIRIAEAQFETIRDFARNGSCVIIGRCADYVLRNNKSALHVFIRANIEKRVERAIRLYKLDKQDATKLIKKTDKIRSNYYSSHTHSEWGTSDNYTLILDSGVLGIDGCVDTIAKASQAIMEKKK